MHAHTFTRTSRQSLLRRETLKAHPVSPCPRVPSPADCPRPPGHSSEQSASWSHWWTREDITISLPSNLYDVVYILNAYTGLLCICLRYPLNMQKGLWGKSYTVWRFPVSWDEIGNELWWLVPVICALTVTMTKQDREWVQNTQQHTSAKPNQRQNKAPGPFVWGQTKGPGAPLFGPKLCSDWHYCIYVL